MVMSVEIPKKTYDANGVTVAWPLTFTVEDEDHVAVYVTDADGIQTLVEANYDVDLDTQEVTYPTVLSGLDPIASGNKVTVKRNTPQDQQLTLSATGPFNAANIMKALDHVVAMVQEMKEALDRSIQYPVSADPESIDPDGFILDVETAVSEAEAAATASEVAQGLSEDAKDAAVNAKNYAEAAAGSMTLASQAEAEAGTDNTKYLSSLRADQAIQARKVRAGTGAIAAGVVAINAALYDVVNVAVDDDFTLNIPTGGQAGQRVSVRLTQNVSGNHALTLHESFLIASELVTDGVVLSTASGSIDKIGLYCVDGTVWEVEAFGTDYAVAA
jgi:hypothetical protein